MVCVGRTPLHFASGANNVEMVRLLVTCGAAVLMRTSDDQETPSQKCDRNLPGYEDCAEFLLGKASSVVVKKSQVQRLPTWGVGTPWRCQTQIQGVSDSFLGSKTKIRNLVSRNVCRRVEADDVALERPLLCILKAHCTRLRLAKFQQWRPPDSRLLV